VPEKTEPGAVRWCPDCQTKNPARPGSSWACVGCGVVWMRVQPVSAVPPLPVDTNHCSDCGRPRFYHWKRLEPHEWCQCPATLKARDAIARWLS
jgi:hypothetical protein